MTQAPTPGPLSADDEMLYARAIVFATRDKPSTSYLQRRLQIGFNLAASLIERMEKEGLISKANSAGKRTIIVPFSAPTAPVEASGSEREHGPRCWGKTSISDEMMYCYCGSTDSPPGETREALDRLKMAAHVYEDDEMAADCATLEALLSARPLTLGGQKGNSETLRVLLDNLVIAQTLSKDIRQKATDEARSYLYDLRHTPKPSGETREAAGCAEPQVGRAVYERIEKLLTTDPQGWERDYLCHLVESVEELGGYDGPRVDGRNDRQTVADFLKLRDESVAFHEADDVERLESADAILALLSARPLALGGQQRESDLCKVEKAITAQPGVKKCIAHGDISVRQIANAVLRVMGATPARAEAQDEGAAGEPVAKVVRKGFSTGSISWTKFGQDADLSDETPLYAHPSPTPGADDDRVRIAVEALEPFAHIASHVGLPKDDTVHVTALDGQWIATVRREDFWNARQALAALKSEGK